MGARQSEETKKAIKLYQQGGISIAAAAARYGLLPTTLYRALDRAGIREMKRVPAKCNTL